MTRPRDLARALLTWYRRHRRELPWRRNPEPWRVLVAETMLQQTRVAAVAPRYEAFLARFPDPAALAGAGEEEVLARWSGLGYYRRARSLHAAARAIVERHGGRVPAGRDELQALPGVGPYTAGAVLSIAFDLPEPVVDGNVERVLSRLHLVRGNVKRGEVRGSLRDRAGALVREGPPALVNQALMELGSLVCLPRAPRCGDCPLAGPCVARAEGVAGELPERPRPPRSVSVALAVALARRDGRVLLAKAPRGGFLAGIWGPPFARVGEGEEPAEALRAAARRDHDLELAVGGVLGAFRHTITRHRIEAVCFAAGVSSGPREEGARFVSEGDLSSYGLSSLARKSLALQP